MITDSYNSNKTSLTTPEAFYGPQQYVCDVCLMTFSKDILDYVLDNFMSRRVAEKRSCRGNEPIYVFEYEGHTYALVLTGIGASMTVNDIVDANWLTGATKFVMFGSAGTINEKKTEGKYVVPTKAYRDEGTSYHYAPPSDYIELPGSYTVSKVMEYLDMPYVEGATWTTDAFYRETVERVNERRKDGCLVVDMEVSGAAAACDFMGFELYDFLECGDVLDGDNWNEDPLLNAHHDLRKLGIALEIARRVDGKKKSGYEGR